jgi:hypothetical protein
MQGDRLLLFCAGVSHPCPQGHVHPVSSCAQEVAADGWSESSELSQLIVHSQLQIELLVLYFPPFLIF